MVNLKSKKEDKNKTTLVLFFYITMENMEDIKEVEELVNNSKKGNPFLRFIKEIYPYVIIVVVVLFVKTYIIAPIQVNGISMDSTLKDGDIMLLNKLQYKRYGVKRGDIVVIKNRGSHIIKRIIGLPGDNIKVEDNILYINGKEYKEDYLDKGTVTNNFSLEELFDTDKVPEGTYFVMGDNRDDSLDSRILGFIDEDDIEGIASITIFPFDRLGSKE